MRLLKTILCIDDQQTIPFRSTSALEPAGYIVFYVSDVTMAAKVAELFRIDFNFDSPTEAPLPKDIIVQVATVARRLLKSSGGTRLQPLV